MTIETYARIRDPRPPHRAIFTILPGAMRYSFKVRATQTAALSLSRGDPNAARLHAMIMAGGEPPMVTIERADGFMPWVGFITDYRAPFGDPHVTLMMADHRVRFAETVCRQSGAYNIGSGDLLKLACQDMNANGPANLYVNFSTVGAGPISSYTFRLDAGDRFVSALEQQTGWEMGFAYSVSAAEVETFLTWKSRQGRDRRVEVWEEARPLADVSYSINYRAGIGAAISVGGTGAFAERPAVGVSRTSAKPEGVTSTAATSPAPIHGFGGTRVIVNQQISDPDVLRTQNEQALDSPEYVTEQLSGKLDENATDMSQLACGDITRVRLPTTNLGQSLDRIVRIIGIEIHPETQVHDLELQTLEAA